MKYKNFSKDIWNRIEKSLEAELRSSSHHPIAAFDADGTLWDTDLGESFFKYQIKKKLVSLPENPWSYYRTWKDSGDPRPAYLWLAQINKNQKLQKVRQWAEDAVREISPLPIFPEIEKLISYLLSKKVEVYIVTASIKWSVEPGGQRLGVPLENVLGVQTKVKNGIITDEQEGLITFREGKAEALLEVTNGNKPFLCVGNSMGDLSLLESAKEALVVGAACENHELFSTEERLRQEGQARSWMVHRFQ